MRHIAMVTAGALLGWIVRGGIADEQIAQIELEQQQELNTAYEQILIYGKNLSAELQRNDKIATDLKNEQNKKNRIIEKEIIRYVEKTDSNNFCILPADWVQLHNAAATNTVPATNTARGTNAATATAGRALETIASNYIDCNIARQRLIGLQQFVRTTHEQARP